MRYDLKKFCREPIARSPARVTATDPGRICNERRRRQHHNGPAVGPPKYLQPFLTDIAQTAYRNSQTPPGFYPGPTFLGPTQGQLDAYGQQFDYADSVFGGARAPKFAEATDALSVNLQGGGGLGQLGSGITPLATQSLQQGFAGAPSFNPSAFTPGVN
jgi:hypothetical protein